MKQAGAAAAQWISDKWNAFVSWLSGIGASIKQWGSDTWDGIKNTAKGAVDGIANFFGGLKDKVLGVFDSIIGGIKKAFNWVSDLWGKIRALAARQAAERAELQRASLRAACSAVCHGAQHNAAGGDRLRDAEPHPRGTGRPLSRTDTSRPTSLTVNINVDAHGNLDNDKVAGEIVSSLDRWARVRGKELAL